MAPSNDRSLRDELVQFEMDLAVTAAAGRPSLWVERLRQRVRSVRERLDRPPQRNVVAVRF